MIHRYSSITVTDKTFEPGELINLVMPLEPRAGQQKSHFHVIVFVAAQDGGLSDLHEPCRRAQKHPLT